MPPPPETADGPKANYRPDFLWAGVAERFAEVLRATTLDSLCRTAASAGLPGARADAPMYFI